MEEIEKLSLLLGKNKSHNLVKDLQKIINRYSAESEIATQLQDFTFLGWQVDPTLIYDGSYKTVSSPGVEILPAVYDKNAYSIIPDDAVLRLHFTIVKENRKDVEQIISEIIYDEVKVESFIDEETQIVVVPDFTDRLQKWNQLTSNIKQLEDSAHKLGGKLTSSFGNIKLHDTQVIGYRAVVHICVPRTHPLVDIFVS